MHIQRWPCLIAMTLVSLLATPFPAFGQERDGNRGDRGDRGGRFGRDRDNRGRDFRSFGPEDRERMYDRMADWHLRRLSDAYDLNGSQQGQARNLLDQAKIKQRAYSEPIRDEFRSLAEERMEMYRRERDGDPVDEKRRDEIRNRMRELWEKSPLMNPEYVRADLETMLPAEQVEKGRQAWAEWERRREEWGGWGRGPRSEELLSAPSPDRPDPWDRYVEFYVRRYNLDAAQKASAESVLRDVKQRGEMYRQANQKDIQAAQNIEDRGDRRDKLRTLGEPIDKLFDELRTRLDQIPTAAQKTAAQEASPSTRPFRGDRDGGDRSRSAGDRGGDRERGGDRDRDRGRDRDRNRESDGDNQAY